jgi:hypothetical protein
MTGIKSGRSVAGMMKEQMIEAAFASSFSPIQGSTCPIPG